MGKKIVLLSKQKKPAIVKEPEKVPEVAQERTPGTPLENTKWEMFCKLFSTERDFFGNGTECYAEVYGIDITEKGGYFAAAASSSRLLKNVNVSRRINELVDLQISEGFVDKQLGIVITQNSDFGSKVAAIKEYNRLKSRVKFQGEMLVKTDVKDDQFARIVRQAAKQLPED
jgi:hypothetical protein